MLAAVISRLPTNVIRAITPESFLAPKNDTPPTVYEATELFAKVTPAIELSREFSPGVCVMKTETYGYDVEITLLSDSKHRDPEHWFHRETPICVICEFEANSRSIDVGIDFLIGYIDRAYGLGAVLECKKIVHDDFGDGASYVTGMIAPRTSVRVSQPDDRVTVVIQQS